MSDIGNRRALVQAIHIGIHNRGLEGITALMRAPMLVAQVLQDTTNEPFRAYMAMGAEEVAALEAFMLTRQEVQP